MYPANREDYYATTTAAAAVLPGIAMRPDDPHEEPPSPPTPSPEESAEHGSLEEKPDETEKPRGEPGEKPDETEKTRGGPGEKPDETEKPRGEPGEKPDETEKTRDEQGQEHDETDETRDEPGQEHDETEKTRDEQGQEHDETEKTRDEPGQEHEGPRGAELEPGGANEAASASTEEAQAAPASRPLLRSLLSQDLRRGAAAALFAVALTALVEYVVTLLAAPSSVRLPTALRFVLLDVSLWTLFGAVFVPGVALVCATARLLLAVIGTERARAWPGLLVPGSASGGENERKGGGDGERNVSAAPGWLFALLVTAPIYLVASSHFTLRLWPAYHDKRLLTLLLGVIQLGLLVSLGVAALLAAVGLRRLGGTLAPRLGRWNPLGRVLPALGVMALLAGGGLAVALHALPELAMVIPWRLLATAGVLGVGLPAGGWIVSVRGGLLPRGLLPRERRGRRVTLVALPVGLAALVAGTLLWWGGDPETKLLAVTSSPPLHRLINGVRFATDFDRDGYGTLLGENDCAPFDRHIHPGARDLPDNGVDENCDGRDFSLKRMPSYRKGQVMAVPEPFRRDWNFLLITIDALRYDHTTFGGYQKKRGRNTTPFLASLVKRSTSFTFANSPSVGTVASMPAILTSKFFHSGIALSRERRGKPPKILPQNVLISEVMKRGGYTTGAITTHEYFNDWGLEQGFDTYDNEIGAKRAPYATTSPRLTRKAIAWIARHSSHKWFLWTHYLDPHGRYVAHPGEKSYGTSEEDLYDGEIHFTDMWLRKLLTELWRMPGGDRTVIVITSDHGDGFREHGMINHGWGLNRELTNVPLIFYIPNLPPHLVHGAVSPLDILPTVAALAGIDVSDLSFEGESLVPQLFYGRDPMGRVVFSETNYPYPQRGAITRRYKLIYNLKANLYQLFDLRSDPWEHRNIYQRNPTAAAKMRRYLHDWMERVFYAQDIHTNQAAAIRKWHLLSGKPHPRHPAHLTFGDGAVEVVGYDLRPERPLPGRDLEVTLYFRIKRRPTDHFSFRVSAWPAPPSRGATAYCPTMPTAHGLFPSTRWKPRTWMRDRFKVRLRKEWRAPEIQIGLEVFGTVTRRHRLGGPTRSGRGMVGLLGRAPLSRSRSSRPGAGAKTGMTRGKPGRQRRRGCGCGASPSDLPRGPVPGWPLLLGLMGLGLIWRRRRRQSHP